ncbi:MAG: DUF2911 domain-containing protein [Cyclobacteriaceae bacterium]
MKTLVGFIEIKVEYERPSARGRKIFGGLVPYDKVWRTGAGRNTLISFSTPVIISDKEIAAGTYNLLSVPGKERWEIILNNDTTLWGTYNYDSSWDVTKFSIPVEDESIYFETMTISIDVTPYDAVLHLMWGNVHIKFGIETQTDKAVGEFIADSLQSGLSLDARDYFSAANYLFMKNERLELALELVSKSLELQEAGYAYGQQAELLNSLDRKKDALAVAEKGRLWELRNGMDGKYFEKLILKLEGQ